MADNQITPFQLTDQFTMDNFNQRINETNTALQKKADADLSNVSNETMKAKIESSGFTGGILPQIIVAAPSGSTVTCTKGETVLTAQEVEGTWTFDVPEYGDWTVSDGDVSKTVVIDSVKIYNERLYEQVVNYTMLYDYGDECADITGGWNTDVTKSGICVKNDTNIYGKGIGNSGGATISTANNISADGYSSLALIIDDILFYQCNVYRKISWGETTFLEAQTGPISSNEQYITLDKPLVYSLTGSENGVITAIGINTGGASGSAYCITTFYAACLTKSDKWHELAEKAGITASSISDVISSAETLLSSRFAVIFMIYNCTGDFMVSAIQSSTFLSALESSPYKELVYANEHWAKFLAMVA